MIKTLFLVFVANIGIKQVTRGFGPLDIILIVSSHFCLCRQYVQVFLSIVYVLLKCQFTRKHFIIIILI